MSNAELLAEARDATLYARTAKHGAVSHADKILEMVEE